MSEFSDATGVISASRGSLWSRKTKNTLNRLKYCTAKKTFVNSNLGLNEQAEEELGLEDLLEQLELLAHAETRPAVRHLKQLLGNLENCKTTKCSLNRMSLKAHVELKVEKKHTEHLHFRATNALHLTANDLQTSNVVCFEVAIVDDGIVLNRVKGISVKVSVLKSTSICEVAQMRIVSKDDQCKLKLQIRNPLIGIVGDDNSVVELEADPSGNSDQDDNEQSRAHRLAEKMEKAKHLRSTYTGLKAFGILDYIVKPLSMCAAEGNESNLQTQLRVEYLKRLSLIYAFSLAFIASYLYLMSKVPYLVPVIMTLCASSFFLLGLESKWTLKAKLTVSLNALSLMVVIVKMFSELAGKM